MIRIGVLSDTHLSGPTEDFAKQIDECFAGVDMIMHAGDLTDISVLKVFNGKELHAVCGNMCGLSSCAALPQKKIVEVGGFRIGLIHGAGYHYETVGRLVNEFEPVDCIVYGHTHRADCQRTGETLLVNPGTFRATGRFGAPGTYAIIEAGDTLTVKIYEVGESA